MSIITKLRPAGRDHQVVTVESSKGVYRKKPCKNCPWRKDAVGEFPPEAFAHSANTAYDQATHSFGCHESGVDRAATCAGFLLHGADHNITIRIKRMTGAIKDDVSNGGHELFESYRSMAIANGLDPDHPALAPCRD